MLISKLYPDTRIYGPYFAKCEGRFKVEIYYNSNDKTVMNYSRFLMQEKLDRLLITEEQVDHIDEDKTNDDINNLQILTKLENGQKNCDSRRLYADKSEEICFQCERKFFLTRAKQASRKHKEGIPGPFCSRKCSGKYNATLRR